MNTAKTYEESQALVHVSRPNLYRDREIRAGWKDGSSPTSTEAKIRDHRGDSTDNLTVCIGAVGFRNIRDRWLRVTDGCGGDPGSIGEFCSLLG